MEGREGGRYGGREGGNGSRVVGRKERDGWKEGGRHGMR